MSSLCLFFICIGGVILLTDQLSMQLMGASDAVLLPMHTVQQPDEPRVLGSAPDEPISHLMKKCPSQTATTSTSVSVSLVSLSPLKPLVISSELLLPPKKVRFLRCVQVLLLTVPAAPTRFQSSIGSSL